MDEKKKQGEQVIKSTDEDFSWPSDMNKAEEKEEKVVPGGMSSPRPPQKTCPFCGGRFVGNPDTCPHCGRSLLEASVGKNEEGDKEEEKKEEEPPAKDEGESEAGGEGGSDDGKGNEEGGDGEGEKETATAGEEEQGEKKEDDFVWPSDLNAKEEDEDKDKIDWGKDPEPK